MREFHVADEVEGLYRNGQWYPARIRLIQDDGKYLLDWNDGDAQDRVKSKVEIRMLASDGQVCSQSKKEPTMFRENRLQD